MKAVSVQVVSCCVYDKSHKFMHSIPIYLTYGPIQLFIPFNTIGHFLVSLNLRIVEWDSNLSDSNKSYLRSCALDSLSNQLWAASNFVSFRDLLRQ